MIYQTFSSETIIRLINTIEICHYIPNQQIIQTSESLNENEVFVYAIIKGSVKIYMADKCIKKLEEKESFGQHSFFTNDYHEYTAKSMEYTTVFKINRAKFLKIICLNNFDR